MVDISDRKLNGRSYNKDHRNKKDHMRLPLLFAIELKTEEIQKLKFSILPRLNQEEKLNRPIASKEI